MTLGGDHDRRFFRARIDQMIDLRHPLAVLARRMPWAQIEASVAPLFAHKNRSGLTTESADLFGAGVAVADGSVSTAGRPRLSIRLMVSPQRPGLLHPRPTL